MTSPHASPLFDEIQAQPGVLAQLLERYPRDFNDLNWPGFFTQKIIGIAEGSSYHAFKIAAPFIEEYTGLNTFSFEPEALLHKFEIAESINQPMKRLFEHSYFIAVSQSGQTGSIVNMVNRLQELLGFSDRYCPVMTVTNNPKGSLPQRFGNTIPLDAGEERLIAATKSMTASILALLLFGLRLGKKRAWLRRHQYEGILGNLFLLPQLLRSMLQDSRLEKDLRHFVSPMTRTNQFVLLSKGLLSQALAECGLKLTETSSNLVWTDNTESFKHGRKVILSGVNGVTPNCIYVVPPELSETAACAFFADVESHFFMGPHRQFPSEGVHFIRFMNSPPLPEKLKADLGIAPHEVLTLPEASGIGSVFATIVVFQMISLVLAEARGLDPNHPALVKAVIQ